jgi:antitoxin VapB
MAMNVDNDIVLDESGVKLAERLLRIGKDCAAHLKEPLRTGDHGTILYDDRGLPRPK